MPGKPMRFFRGSFSNSWFATKRYFESEDGRHILNTEPNKEDVTGEVNKIILWTEVGTLVEVLRKLTDEASTMDDARAMVSQWLDNAKVMLKNAEGTR